MKPLILLACVAAAMILACGGASQGGEAAMESDSTGMVLASVSFAAGDSIPKRYSLYGENISPDFAWERAPEATKGFALVCRDPDAPGGTFYHWVLFNVPGNVRSMPEGIGRDPVLPMGGTQGTNSFRHV